jgi:hypothetical protein
MHAKQESPMRKAGHIVGGSFEAQAAEPELAGQALDTLGALYAVEAKIQENKLKGEAKREYRLDHARPVVETFFTWVKSQLEAQGLLPSNPLTKALAYVQKLKTTLEVCRLLWEVRCRCRRLIYENHPLDG